MRASWFVLNVSHLCECYLWKHREAQRVKVEHVIARGWYGFHPRKETMLLFFPRSLSFDLLNLD